MSLRELAGSLEAGTTSSRALVSDMLAAISDHPDGARIYPHGPDRSALEQADAADTLRRNGQAPRFAGIPLSIKDNIAQRGVPLCAGSTFLKDDGPAAEDAEVVGRLRAAGIVVIGRTGMTELAFSGLGINSHYGTPANPVAAPCVPGGSSAGAAVSVATGMAAAAIGTDTSGSCRIPAAFCNLVGFKPTAYRVPLEGVFPLSHSLDSVGILGRSVDCCAAIDAIIAEDTAEPVPCLPLATLKLADLSVALGVDTDPHVTTACNAAIERLRHAGVSVETLDLDVLPRMAAISSHGGFGSAELFLTLKERLAGVEAAIDPRVLRRIRKGEQISAESYRAMLDARAEAIRWAEAHLDGFDAVLMPTVAILPPRLTDLAADEDFDRINVLVLRNAGIANMLDQCAVTIPCSETVGLTLMGKYGADRALLAMASALESVIRGNRG